MPYAANFTIGNNDTMKETDTRDAGPDNPSEDATERKLHFGQSEVEMALYELQHALVCHGEAFARYAGMQLSRIVDEPNMTGPDCVILQCIKAGDRPKSIMEIQHYTNRTDTANIQYSLKKLTKAGLIEKIPQEKGRKTVYGLTATGTETVERYVKARHDFIDLIPKDGERFIDDVKTARRMIILLTGYYDNASRSLTVE